MKSIKEKLLTMLAKIVVHGPRIFPIVFYCTILVLAIAHLVYLLVTDFAATATGLGVAFGFLFVIFGGMYLVHKLQIWMAKLHDKIDDKKQKARVWAQEYLKKHES